MDNLKRRDFLKLVTITVASGTVAITAPPIIAKQIKPLKHLEAIYRLKAIEYDERIYDDYNICEATGRPILTSKKEAKDFAQRMVNLLRRTVEFECSHKMIVGDIITIKGISPKQIKCRVIEIKQLWNKDEQPNA